MTYGLQFIKVAHQDLDLFPTVTPRAAFGRDVTADDTRALQLRCFH